MIGGYSLYRKVNQERKEKMFDWLKFKNADSTASPICWTPGSDREFVHKHPDEMIPFGQQLLVREGQEAIFLKGGQATEPITPQTVTLTSGNMPGVLEKLLGKTGCYGAEVWFVSTTAKRNLRWGTSSRIPVPYKQSYQVKVGGYGQWGFRIVDSLSFVRQLVGAQHTADSEQIYDGFIGELVQRFTVSLGKMLSEENVSILNMAAKYTEISNYVMAESAGEFARFGIELVNFTVENINIAPEDLAQIQKLSAGAFEMETYKDSVPSAGYMAAQQLKIMQEAAKNPGAPGMMAGMGMGMGLGVGFGAAGQMVGQTLQPQQSAPQPPPAGTDDPIARLNQLKQLLDQGILTSDEYAAKRQAIIEKL